MGQEAVCRLEGLEKVHSDVTLAYQFGNALVVLNTYSQLLGKLTIPSFRLACLAFKVVVGSHYDSSRPESVIPVKLAVVSWALTHRAVINYLKYQTDICKYGEVTLKSSDYDIEYRSATK